MCDDSPLAGNPEFRAGWDVYRDADGNPVTITPQQSAAIWHAVSVVEDVRESEGQRSLWDGPGGVDLAKSRLLGRMLFQGLPPTRTRPPLNIGGPSWKLLPGGDPFA